MGTKESIAPMTLDEVRKLRAIKKTSDEKISEIEKLTKVVGEKEIIDGLTYPKGTESIGIPAGEKSAKDVNETDQFRPTSADLDYLP